MTQSQIELGYGRESVSLQYDEGRFRILGQPELDDQPLSDLQVGLALETPIGSPALEDIVSPGQSVLIVVSDATRATASAQIVNLLVRRLIQFGIAPGDIAIIFATGIHRPVTQSEKLELLTPFVVQRIRTIDHDPHDPKPLRLGELPGGVPIELNRSLSEYDHVIITGAIGFHYFAGFTGGRKSLCPGLASARTIAATHMLALDFERGGRRVGVGTGLLDGNAVNEACELVAQQVDPSFSINTVIDSIGRSVHVYAGDWRVAHSRGCEEYLDSHKMVISEKRDLVIASCGGSPSDINLIQAHKAMDMAAQACNPGGTLVLLAQCGDGLGRSDFMKWFEPPDARSLELLLRDGYEVNGQTAWSLRMKTETFHVCLVSDLPDDLVRKMGMTPMRALTDALRETDKSDSGFIMPRGAAILPVVET